MGTALMIMDLAQITLSDVQIYREIFGAGIMHSRSINYISAYLNTQY